MPSQIWMIAGPVIAAIITGVISAWLTASLAFRRFRHEKWWDEKFRAYSDILSSLHNIAVGFDESEEAIMRGGDIPADRQKFFHEQYLAGKATIERQADLADFLLHKDVTPRIVKMLNELDAAYGLDDTVEHIHHATRAARTCIQDITKIARADLRVG